MNPGLYDAFPLTFPRRKTRPVRVGNVVIGGEHPIVVQSMITEETKNVDACVRQILQMHRAGAEIVRVTTPTLMEAHKLGEIKQKLQARLIDVPLVADVHHQGAEIAKTVAAFVDKVRLNPGLFVFHKHSGKAEFTDAEHEEQRAAIEESLLPVIDVCKRRDIAMRIGVNHGSLAERMLVTYGDTPEGMVESALEYLRICQKHGYGNLVVSLKASRVPVMLAANRLMARRMAAEGMDYPLHLGVTEAGDGPYARIKSTAGIATLLAEGIGDTIRVSLAEDPVNELPVCYEILQALGLRKTQVEFIACPSCGRTKFDLPTVLNQVRDATRHLVGLDIAVMGCFPPGESVVTEEGFVPIETIAAGRRVLTHEGAFAPVTAVESHHFSGELVEIRLHGAPPLRLTPNHPVLALTRTARAQSPEGEPTWFAADQIGRDHTLLYPVLQGEEAILQVPEVPELTVDERFLSLAACYCARGGRHGIADPLLLAFGADETEWAARARDILCRYGAAVSLRARPDRNTQEVIVHSAEWAARLERLFGQPAERKRLPHWMLTLPRERQRLFLQALWRCGGSLGTVRGYPRASYATASPALAYQVHQLLLRQGVAATLVRRSPARCQPVYRLAITSADALRRLAQVLEGPLEIPPGRPRTPRPALNTRYLSLPVLSVARIPYAGSVHNLEVAGAQTFVSSLCLVHNCIVNGPGEMADADYGYVGKAGGMITLYRKREPIKTVPQERGVDELVALIQADGRWQDPA